MTQTITSRAGHAPSRTNDFSDVDCVVIDSPIKKSRDSGWYCHVWVDGDKSKEENHKYLSVTEDQADWIARNQNKILKPNDWDVVNGKTWLFLRPEDTRVQPVVVPPDTTQYIQDDVDRLYPPEQEEPALSLSTSRVLLTAVRTLKGEYPEMDYTTLLKAAITEFLNQ